MRPPLIPGTARSVNKVTGRARDLERRFVESAGAATPADNVHPPSLQGVPFGALNNGMLDDISGFNHVEADTAAAGDQVFTNRLGLGSGTRTPANGDYFTLPVTLGPKGSIWGLVGTWKLQSSGGMFVVTLASVPTAGRSGADDEGTLADPGTVTYHSIGSITEDTYQGGSPTYDGGSSVYTAHIRIGGDPGDPFTAITGTDAVTGFNVIDGGPGEYRWKLAVTGKSGPSSGYRIDLMQFAWVRITDSFYV